jgi:hypothetical protein
MVEQLIAWFGLELQVINDSSRACISNKCGLGQNSNN